MAEGKGSSQGKGGTLTIEKKKNLAQERRKKERDKKRKKSHKED